MGHENFRICIGPWTKAHSQIPTISAALLCLRRCAGHNVALRRLRFAFDSYHSWDGVHVDQWLHYLLEHGCTADRSSTSTCALPSG
jgi:hypothetical protein